MPRISAAAALLLYGIKHGSFATSPPSRRTKGVAFALAIYQCPLLLLFIFILLPTSASALRGHVHHHRHRRSDDVYGGQQPVAGSHLYLFAISTAGYGSAPISLLHGSGVSVDSANNGYIVTGADGSFNISNLYAEYCPTSDASVYLQALGGDPGDGSDNSAIDLVTVLPLTCSQLPNASSVNISELTTVAAASALLRYAKSSTISFSASVSNPQALLNAVINANNLVSGYTAVVGSTAYSGSLTIPVPTINSIADILAECVNNGTSSPACTQLFANATPDGGPAPTDVLQAAINIARNPASNVANLFNLIPGIGAPFVPMLSAVPLSWAISYGVSTPGTARGNTVTIDHTKVSNTDQINFPIAILVPANPMLRTASNGGSVQSGSGYDILFTSDQAGQNLLDFEIDNYNPATGAGTFWIRIPDLSPTMDTVIYIWYGIPGISNSLENTLGVWSNNYLSVYHFGNGSSLGTMDSAIAGYNLSGAAAPSQGQFGGAASFSGDPNVFLYYENVAAYPTGSNPVTLESWEQSAQGSDLVGYGLVYNPSQAIGMVSVAPVWGLITGGPGVYSYLGTQDTNWHSMVAVYGGGDLSSQATELYYDGQQVGTGRAAGVPNVATNELTIGQYPQVRGCCTLTGAVDEVRISSGTRSADWIATEFNNGSSPTTFGRISPALLYTSSLLLSSSTNPASYGQPIVLTAMAIGQTSSSNIAPTGSVTFYDGTTNLGLVTVGTNGVAVMSTSALSVGSHSITASYSGDSNYSGSTSSPLAEAVTAVYASTMTCIPSAISSGENITCAVMLVPGALSAVSFSIGGSGWTSATPDATGSAVANATITESTPGTYTVAYSYPGDPNIPAASGTAQITVNPAGTQPSGNGIYSFSITDQYGNSGYALNSNINAYNDSVNGIWSMVSSGPGYDNLNRLTYATVTPIVGPSKWACWAYDSFGNMLTQGISTQAFSNPATCQAQEGATTLQNTFSYATNINQITSGTWLDAGQNSHTGSPIYDPSGAGYVTNDLINSYLYDAEGNICAMQPVGGGTITGYLYDAEGHRVAKGTLPGMTCDSTQLQFTTLYFIGPDNETMTEISSSGWVRTEVSAAGQHLATYRPDGIYYPITDWLGTKRVVVNPNLTLNNGIEETCTSFPFGDQLNCSTPIDASPTHFTGKERDYESGNDYFGARYLASGMGRWTSPDPSNLGVDIYLPQTWNRYNYAVNDPLAIKDANGLWPFWGHDAIYNEAFPGMSKHDLDFIKDASFAADFGAGQQDPQNAYKHGMSDGSGTVFYGGGNGQHAWDQAETYIDDQVQAAQEAQANWIAQGHTGFSPLALHAFGNALHLVTDRTSPEHEGEQPWANKPWWNYHTFGHFFGEILPLGDRRRAAVTASQTLLHRIFGFGYDWTLQKEPCAQSSVNDHLGNVQISGCQ